MPIRCLSFVEYGDTGWGRHPQKAHNPTRDDVAAALPLPAGTVPQQHQEPHARG
jgi:hypothetical protein